VLIVGCGCRGQALARDLVAGGHAVRGTTRRAERTEEIRRAGAEPVVADPDRVATLMSVLDGVTVACWLLGGVDVAPLHGTRLRFFLEKVVDTPVRGFVYEVPHQGGQGRGVVEEAARTWAIPVRFVEGVGRADWPRPARAAIEALLA
jgi:hypothetical protein